MNQKTSPKTKTYSATRQIKKNGMSDWDRLQKLIIKDGEKINSVRLIREDRNR
jgi:hypothetical protein